MTFGPTAISPPVRMRVGPSMETSRRVHAAALAARYRLDGLDAAAPARPPAVVVPALFPTAPGNRRRDPSTAGASEGVIAMSPAGVAPGAARADGADACGFASRPARVAAGAGAAGGICTLGADPELDVLASQSGRCFHTYGATPASRPTRTTMPRIFELFMPIPRQGDRHGIPRQAREGADPDMWQTRPRPEQRETRDRLSAFKRVRCEMNSTRVTPDGAPRVARSPRP
jgi:hypothetical protein